MSDSEILDKYVDLDKSCPIYLKKKQVMGIQYKHKDTLSLRDEIGTCPNIEAEIHISDKSPFFIRPYHVKEEDKKKFLGQENEKIVLFRYIKRRF